MTAEHAKEVRLALVDIAERAEHECAVARRAGERQGNYQTIARAARRALRLIGDE